MIPSLTRISKGILLTPLYYLLYQKLCYISQQFNEDMKHARQTRRGLRKFDREFLLPDFVNTFQGTVQLSMPLQMMRELEEDKRQQLNKDKETAKKTENKATASNKNSTDVVGSDNITVQPKQKKKRKQSEVADEKVNDEPDENDASDLESDEETEQQRLQRVKRMREQEQKRREAEAKDRQALALSVERFAVPEVLFTPSDLGLDIGGIADAIVESINACDATLRAAMYHNVLLVGGNAKIPGFMNRLETELRKLTPTQYVVRVFLPEDPLCYAWEVR
jgi:actin-related protein